MKYELIEHNLSHITHLCCEVENMPSKNFCNKCYIPLQFSITFRWSDRGKKKVAENLLSSKLSGVLAKITNLWGLFLEVLIHKINATNKYVDKRYRVWFRLLIQIDLWMWPLTYVSLSWFWEWGPIGFFFLIQTILATTRCIRIERIK